MKWLSVKDEKSEVFPLNSKLDITVDEVRFYIVDLVELYMRRRVKAKNSTWGVNPAGHEKRIQGKNILRQSEKNCFQSVPAFTDLTE